MGVWLFWAASHYTVFDDEAFSCLRYTMPLGEMVRGLWHGVEPDPPLYYVLENLWIRVVGVGPLGLRSLSIVLFLIGLVVMRRAASAWFDERVALVTFILCAIHPAHHFFGFAARWYSCMFLTVAVLLWATARMTGNAVWRRLPAGGMGLDSTPAHAGAAVEGPLTLDGRQGRRPLQEAPAGALDARGPSARPWLVWALAAAAVCYTNYFGAVVVGLVWLVGAAQSENKRPWGRAAIAVIVLYAPWLPAFWQQATTFPQVGGGLSSYAATAARTSMALLAGDLAGPRAWWVWAPMVVFVLALMVLLVQRWAEVWPIALIVVGCFVAGVASRTMIDKYVMTFSGPACLLVAALFAFHGRQGRRPLPARVAAVALALAWIGCGVNLVTQRHWSSLRWLDPWARVITEWLSAPEAAPITNWVVSHPSGRYYIACVTATRHIILPWPATRTLAKTSGPVGVFIAPGAWRAEAEASGNFIPGPAGPPATPALMITRFDVRLAGPSRRDRIVNVAAFMSAGSPNVITIESADFEDDSNWKELREWLDFSFELRRERVYLSDPDAEIKDRLDPTYKHPRYRITVRLWRLKDSASATTAPAAATSGSMNRG